MYLIQLKGLKMKKYSLLLLCLSLFAQVAFANKALIVEELTPLIGAISVDNVKETEVKGIYQVLINAQVIYVSADGRYIFQGHLLDTKTRKDLTELTLNQVRKQQLSSISEKEMVIFPAKDAKHTLTIFSDIDCGYCRKLHAGISDYTDLGITVRYLFYPRSGPNTESYHKAVSVWCAEDRNQALTDAKINNKVISKSCDNPVDKHMKLAQTFGVRGTPAILTEDGVMLPGYLPAKELVARLNW